MRIIEEGEDRFEKKCPYCGCIFTFNYGDMYKKRNWKDSLGFWSDVYVGCPQCNSRNKIGSV